MLVDSAGAFGIFPAMQNIKPQDLATPATAEYFSSYRGRCWHAGQPLAVLHQWYEEGADTGAWRHVDFYALYVVRGGRGIHVINGHPYPIRRGDVYMTPPGAVHSYRDFRQLKAEAFCFQAQLFTDEELDTLAALPGFREIFIRGVTGEAQGTRDYQLHLAPPDYQAVEQVVEDLFGEMQRAEAVSPIVVRGLMFRLLVFLARAHARATDDLANSLAASVGRPTAGLDMAEILQICDSHFAEGLSVPQLAALVFLSPSHFSEIFAREVGTPPATYLRQIRLEHAQMLLRTTSLTMTEIAQQSGFGDSAQLSHAFKAALGLTPREYRRKFSGGS
jgi:AraC-like DNA-binding protein/mannose-6-phosphate isomerase-like protein (cupin superfamily)